MGGLLVALAFLALFVAAARSRKAGSRKQRADPHDIRVLRAEPSSRPVHQQLVRISADFVSIGDEFFVSVARSPDGKYLVAARDHLYENNRERQGRCALLDIATRTVLFSKTIRRANHPHVSNDGVVVVEDWKGDQQLNGALLAFDSSGRMLWRHDYKANIGASGMSSDGSRVFVSTCNSDYEPHSGRTFLLHARTGQTIWERDGWGNIRFEANDLVAEIKGPGERVELFAFDERGELPAHYFDRAALLEAERNRGQYWSVLPRVEAALRNDPPDLDRARMTLDELDGKDGEIPERSLAKVIRYRGELAAAAGQLEQAVDLWQRALALDPKVGVKKKLDAAKGKIGVR